MPSQFSVAAAEEESVVGEQDGHSFTANPLGCAAANASLDLLEAEPDKYLGFEARHRSRLEVLARHPGIRRVRLTGTIAAFDLVVTDQEGYLNRLGKAVNVVMASARSRCPFGKTIKIQ